MARKKALMTAVFLVLTCTVGGIIVHGSSVQRQAALDQELINAIYRNDISGVERALDRGASARARDVGHLPSSWQRFLNMILHRSAGDAPDEKPGSALMLAMMGQHLDIAEALIKHGAEANQLDISGTSLLMDAIYGDNEALINVLLQHGADPNVANKDGDTPLMWAAEKYHPVVVQRLLAQGANPNAQNNLGQAPLMWACGPHDSHLPPLHRNSRGITTAHELERQRNQLIVSALLAQGANPNLQDHSDNSAMAYAALESPWLLSAFLAHGGDVNARIMSNTVGFKQQGYGGSANWSDNFGPNDRRTLLIQAAITHKVEMLCLLLAHHADVNAKDSNGKTALQRTSDPQIRALLRPFHAR